MSWRHRHRERGPCGSAATDESWISCHKSHTRAWRQGALICCCYYEHAPCRSERWSLIGRWTSYDRSDTGYLVTIPTAQEKLVVWHLSERSASGHGIYSTHVHLYILCSLQGTNCLYDRNLLILLWFEKGTNIAFVLMMLSHYVLYNSCTIC